MLFLCFYLTPQNRSVSETLFPADWNWKERNGWKIYGNAGLEGCLGERELADGTVFLLGVIGADKSLMIAFSNDRIGFAELESSYTLDLVFNKKRQWQTGFTAIEFAGRKMLLGRYKDAARIKRDIARYNTMRITHGKRRLGTFSLKGTSAALKEIDNCHATPIADLVTAEIKDKEQQADKLHEAGRFGDAEPILQELLDWTSRTFGEDSPITAQAMSKLALVVAKNGSPDRSLALLERAETIYTRSLGPENELLVSNLNSRGNILREASRYDEAETALRRALSLSEDVFGAEHPNVGAVSVNLGQTLLASGKPGEAKEAILEGLELIEKDLDAFPLEYSAGLLSLAEINADRGETQSATEMVQKALETVERTYGAEHFWVAETLRVQAYVLIKTQDLKNAETSARRALHILEGLGATNKASKVSVLLALSDSLPPETAKNVNERLSIFHRILDMIGDNENGLFDPDLAEHLERLIEAHRTLLDSIQGTGTLQKVLLRPGFGDRPNGRFLAIYRGIVSI